MTPPDPALAGPAQHGIRCTAASDLAALESAATAAGLRVSRIDLRGCRDKPALLKRMARAMHIPATQGRNWDALADQLRDLGWLPESSGHLLLFTHTAALRANAPASFTTLLSILTDAAEHWRARGVSFQSVFTLPDAALCLHEDSRKPR